jgi:hypothetical protein
MTNQNAYRGTEQFALFIVSNFMMKFWRVEQKVITAYKKTFEG